MKFGIINSKLLDKADFTLSSIRKASLDHLDSLKPYKTYLKLGTSVWADSSFKNKLYPQKTKPSDYLKIYSSIFDCIELNTTFYGTPSKERILKWKNSVNDGFKFCPKVPKTISHRKNIYEKKDDLNRFIDSMLLFDNNLGTIFLQLPQYFCTLNTITLFKFIELIPYDLDFAVEFRHPSWFEKDENNVTFIEKYLFAVFTKKNIGIIVTDTLGRRDVLHQFITCPTIFIRFVGNNLHDSDYKRIDLWAKRIDFLKKNNICNIYFIIHQSIKSNSLDLYQYLKSII